MMKLLGKRQLAVAFEQTGPLKHRQGGGPRLFIYIMELLFIIIIARQPLSLEGQPTADRGARGIEKMQINWFYKSNFVALFAVAFEPRTVLESAIVTDSEERQQQVMLLWPQLLCFSFSFVKELQIWLSCHDKLPSLRLTFLFKGDGPHVGRIKR